ncbi:MAG TPA: hypothetical protein VFX58_18410 [Chitinophagaceae bacterium]|nr:hypothetical protein [Chitinophagaceae bacterium]
MKQTRFLLVPLFAASLMYITSCGGGDSKEQTGTDSTMTSDSSAPVVNTIITTPQNLMVAKHRVADYAKWQASYDAHDSVRLANGIHSYVIGRGLLDSNMVLVAVKVDDLEKARAFAKDPSLKQAMQKGGVTGTPKFSFVTNEWQDTVNVSSDIRSITNFVVKDWEAWKNNFFEGKEERLANGITDRVVGHDADDNKKVSLVTAVTDTAKAFAYYKSDALKKRREAGGVTGEPERFLFRIVKRY